MGTPGFGGKKNGVTDYEYFTPPHIFEAIGLEYDLDPAHPPEKLFWVPAKQTYCKADDGLSKDWRGKRIWLNPPYGKETYLWLEKMHQPENRSGVGLVFARMGSPWAEAFAYQADAIFLLRDRIRFCGPDGLPRLNSEGKKSSSDSDSMLIAWDRDCVAALHRLEAEGRLRGKFIDLELQRKYMAAHGLYRPKERVS